MADYDNFNLLCLAWHFWSKARLTWS